MNLASAASGFSSQGTSSALINMKYIFTSHSAHSHLSFFKEAVFCVTNSCRHNPSEKNETQLAPVGPNENDLIYPRLNMATDIRGYITMTACNKLIIYAQSL